MFLSPDEGRGTAEDDRKLRFDEVDDNVALEPAPPPCGGRGGGDRLGTWAEGEWEELKELSNVNCFPKARGLEYFGGSFEFEMLICFRAGSFFFILGEAVAGGGFNW